MWLRGGGVGKENNLHDVFAACETETGRVGGAGFLTSALSPTDAPTDTWCPHRPRGGGTARRGAVAHV